MSKFGFHVGKGNGYSQSIPAAVSFIAAHGFDMRAVQIFIAGPQSTKIIMDPLDADLLKKIDIDIIAHGSYMDLPWSENPQIRATGMKLIKDELALCGRCGAKGLNIHLTACEIKDVVSVVRQLEPALKEAGCRLYLETPARKPTPLTFETSGRIAELAIELNKAVGPSVAGITLDTAHLWSSEEKIDTGIAAYKYIQSIVNSTGKYSFMIHLNDNANEFGIHKDIHAPIGTGKIWGRVKEDPGWLKFIELADLVEGYVILERGVTAASPLDLVAFKKYGKYLKGGLRSPLDPPVPPDEAKMDITT